MHAADVSNPAKPWAYYMQWTDRVLEEFFHQVVMMVMMVVVVEVVGVMMTS